MANIIRIKRRPYSVGGDTSAPAASALQNAELAFNENSNTLYYGWSEVTDANGTHSLSAIAIGGEGFLTSRLSTLSGDIYDAVITAVGDGGGGGGGTTDLTGVTAAGGSLAPANKIPVLDAGGKLPTEFLPDLAITDVFIVGTDGESLTALIKDTVAPQKGDVAIDPADSKTYILAADDPTVSSNWVELSTPIDAAINTLTGSTLKSMAYQAASAVEVTGGSISVSALSAGGSTGVSITTGGVNSLSYIANQTYTTFTGFSAVNCIFDAGYYE